MWRTTPRRRARFFDGYLADTLARDVCWVLLGVLLLAAPSSSDMGEHPWLYAHQLVWANIIIGVGLVDDRLRLIPPGCCAGGGHADEQADGRR